MVFFLMGTSAGHAQTLSEGDIAFTGFNGDGPGDGFAVVVFKSISGSSEIHFSSQEWNGSTFSGSGGDFTWQAPSTGIAAGTVVLFSDVEGTPSVNVGAITDDANMNLSVSGDVIYAYTGVDKDTPHTPFIAAVATAADKYNQPDGTEGTLVNTGLTETSSATIGLNNNIDAAQYTGDRGANTPAGYRMELNKITDNWKEVNGTGNQSAEILPFDTQSFTLVDVPTIAFTASTLSVNESGTSINLDVELVEAGNTAVDLDVAFLTNASKADGADITYSTQTINFGAGASSGDTKTVTVNINSDNIFEGDERAVFQLQNATVGSIIKPRELTLTITGDDAPQIVFNEINADPGDDANGDGTAGDSDTDEFIEWVNNSGKDIDISGWVYADGDFGDDDRFTFPEGTVIGDGNAVVLFDNSGDIQPVGNFGGASIFSDGEVGLNNSSETLALYDANGNLVVSTTYPNEASGESNNLNPDGTGTSYTDHSSLSGSGGALSSPGTQVDGSTWGNGTYAIGLRGNEGYRFVSTPAQNTTFNNLFSNLWTQGIPGSDSPSDAVNIFSWQEGSSGAFSPVANMSDNLTPGRGYIVYVFEDDDYRAPGIQGGFPKTINTSESENNSPVSAAVSSTDDSGDGTINNNEGYNLLGNPFETDISAAAVIDALEAVNPNVNTNISVWDHEAGSGNGGYILLDGSDGSTDVIAPFQAFFVRYMDDGVSGNVSFDRSNLAVNKGADFYKNAVVPDEPQLKFYLGNGRKFDTYSVAFSENGTVGEDRRDAHKLFSLNKNSINLFSTVGNGVQLAKNVLPPLESLQGELRISLGVDLPESGEYTFSWSTLNEISDTYKLYLIDNETDRKIDLRTSRELSFNSVLSNDKSEAKNKEFVPEIGGTASGESSRFELLVVASANKSDNDQELEEVVAVSPNYPNPFRSQTTMDLKLKETMHVKMTIWNIVGQKIATLCDEMMQAGEHPMTWNITANIPSGIYICKVEAGGKVLTRKMTLVK